MARPEMSVPPHRTPLVRDAARFAALSGGCWMLDLAVLLALTWGMSWRPATANVVSSLIAAAVVYWVSHRRIHDGARRGQPIRLAVYLVYTSGVIFLASAALGHLRPVFEGLAMAVAQATILAKVAVTPPQLLCNFVVSRLVARSFGMTATPGA